MRRAAVFARREVEIALTERTLLVAIAIQIFVAGFSSFLVVGLASLVDPSALPGSPNVQVALVNDTARLGEFLAVHDVAVIHTTDEGAMSRFNAGEVDAILKVTGDGRWNGTRPITVNVTLPDGNLRATFAVAKIKEALMSLEREVREERMDRLTVLPPRVESVPKDGGSFEFIYGLLIPLLVFLPVVLSGALVADSFTEEVQRGTLGLLLSTPATLAEVVLGKLAANALLAPILAGAWLGLLALNGMSVSGTLPILLLASASAIVFGGLACVVGLLTRDRHKAHLVYAMVLFLVIALTSFLPQSPVNLVARFAAGSADAVSWALLAAVVTTAAAFVAGLHVVLTHRGLQVLAVADGPAGPRGSEPVTVEIPR